MWMAVLVTPWSVAPVAVPGPHGDARVPNVWPLPDATVVADEDDAEDDAEDDPPVDDDPEDEVRLLLHATAASPTTHSALSPRNHRRL